MPADRFFWQAGAGPQCALMQGPFEVKGPGTERAEGTGSLVNRMAKAERPTSPYAYEREHAPEGDCTTARLSPGIQP